MEEIDVKNYKVVEMWYKMTRYSKSFKSNLNSSVNFRIQSFEKSFKMHKN
jgi:hypothetical protein